MKKGPLLINIKARGFRPFHVCDLREGRPFEDPLKVFYNDDGSLKEDRDYDLFALGGEINSSRLIESYSYGIFPWFPFRDSLFPEWYCPQIRFVIFPNEVHVSHSMRNMFNRGDYQVTYNQNFKEVIENCGKVNGRNDEIGAWLGPQIIKTFLELNRKGVAKSVEVWKEGQLVGGLYGFWHSCVFQGESMFSLAPSASKYALISLCRHMSECDGKMIDCQFETPLFKSLGGREISYMEYRMILDGGEENCHCFK